MIWKSSKMLREILEDPNIRKICHVEALEEFDCHKISVLPKLIYKFNTIAILKIQFIFWKDKLLIKFT